MSPTPNPRCADFCDLPEPTNAPLDGAHGSWCVSTAIGREVSTETDYGSAEITIDLARTRSKPDEPTLIRLVTDPLPPTTRRSVERISSAAARQLAVNLTHAADLADGLGSLRCDHWQPQRL